MPSSFDFVPQRVVSLVPSMTETLFNLNIGDRLVAITDYCTRPPDKVEGMTRVRGTKNPDVAKILELNPDMILMNSEENRLEDYQVFKDAGIAVWVTGPRTVQEGLNIIWDVMDVFEAPEMSARVREIERSYDYTENAMRAERLISVFVPIWKSPWITISQDTYIHDILSVCGGHNVFADEEWEFEAVGGDLQEAEAPPMLHSDALEKDREKRYPRITLEDVEARKPEVVFLPSEPYAFSDADSEIFYNLDIPAARNGHIYAIDGALLSWHGTRMAFALQEIPPIFDKVRKASEPQDTPDDDDDEVAAD